MSIRLRAALASFLLILLFEASPESALSQAHQVEILVPGLPVVRLAPADADAFQRRLNPPPPYIGPLPGGESFMVTTDYWDVALGTGAGGPPTDAAAAYFPAGGIIRVRQVDRDAFFVLDLRQRAMLDRYIRLAKEGAIPVQPGALTVLIAAAQTEVISIEPAGEQLSADQTDVFWRSLHDRNPVARFLNPPQPPSQDGGYWITFTTMEGRAVQFHMDPASGMLTDSLGSETYTIPNIFPSTSEAARITQEAPPGSKLWWPVMLGGGAALLAAAIWLRRIDAGRA